MKNETKWSFDPSHSEIAFKVKHLMIANVRGVFKTFDASIYTTEKDFTTAGIDLWIDAASINTGDEKRDAHLKSSDFLDTDKFKQITFKSSSIEKPDTAGIHELWGYLTIKEISKHIKLKVHFGGIMTDSYGNEKAGFSVEGKINRSEWELTWNSTLEAGGILVGEEISISCEIELTKMSQDNLKMELISSDDQGEIH